MEEKSRKSKIYSKFKSLPLLSSDDEQKLNKIIRKVTLRNKLFKTRTFKNDSFFIKNQSLMNQDSQLNDDINHKDIIQSINNIENDYILEGGLDDSIFSNDSHKFSYNSIESVINFESTLEIAKTKVLSHEKSAKKQDLFFIDNRIFQNLLYGEGSNKEIDTNTFNLKIWSLSQKRNNYYNQTISNSNREEVKTDNTSPSLFNKKIKVLEIRDLENDTNNLFDLDDKQFILNNNLEKMPSKIDKDCQSNEERLKFFHKRKKSLKLINEQYHTFTLDSERKKNHNLNKSNSSIHSYKMSGYEQFYSYKKKTNQLSQKPKNLRFGVIRSIITGQDNTDIDFSPQNTYKKKTKVKVLHRNSIKENVQKVLIKSPTESCLNMKQNMKYHENIVEYIREKNKSNMAREDLKEILRGGRITLFFEEEGKNNVSKIKFILPKTKVEKSVIFIQQFWRYYFNLKKFFSIKIQSIYRGYCLRKKVNKIFFVYFTILNRLNICDNILKRNILNSTLGKIKEYIEFLKSKKYIRTNLLLKRNFSRFYEKKVKQIIRNPERTISPIKEIVVQSQDIDENSVYFLSKDLYENIPKNSKPLFTSNLIKITNKSYITPTILPKKSNYLTPYVIKIQRLIRDFFIKLKRIRSAEIYQKYNIIPIKLKKQIKLSQFNLRISQIVKQFRKFFRKENKYKIFPIIIRKDIKFNLSISSIMHLMFSDLFRKIIYKDVINAFIGWKDLKIVTKLKYLIETREKREIILQSRNLLNIWNNKTIKDKHIQVMNSKENLRKLLRMRTLLFFSQDFYKTIKKIRQIDLIFTFEAIVVRNVKKSIFFELLSFESKKQKFLKTKSILKDLYQEMHLSYLQAMDDYDKIEKEYSRFSEMGESFNALYDLSDEYSKEKMKFKYSKRNKKRSKESENWWIEYEINPKH